MDLMPDADPGQPRRSRQPWAVVGAAGLGVASLAVGALLTLGGTAGAATAEPSQTPGPSVGPNPAVSATVTLPDVPAGPATDLLPAGSTGTPPDVWITLSQNMDSASAFCGLFDHPASDCTKSSVDGRTVFTLERELADVPGSDGSQHGLQAVHGIVSDAQPSGAQPPAVTDQTPCWRPVAGHAGQYVCAAGYPGQPLPSDARPAPRVAAH